MCAENMLCTEFIHFLFVQKHKYTYINMDKMNTHEYLSILNYSVFDQIHTNSSTTHLTVSGEEVSKSRFSL